MVSKRGISRRRVLATSAAAGGLALGGGIPGVFAQGAARIDQLAPELDKIIAATEPIRELANGLGGALGPVEGPVWWKEGGYLLFSDINASKRMKYTPGQGVGVFKDKTNQANGLTRDLQGRLLACEHETRRVTRQELDGSLTVIANSFQGRRLNRPNDVVVKSDDTIWFSDPPFGILGHYEGHKAEQELPGNLYRFDPRTGQTTVVGGEIEGPNGLAFSPDEKILYVVECRTNPRRILAYDVLDDGRRLANRRILIDAGPGTPDGFRVDEDGNLWCGWGMGDPALDGVMIFSPAGEPIGRIALPERCANLCFGGVKRNRLFMAASQSIYALYVNTQGAKCW